ncbi:MG284/MPN403 family protein [Mycoplasmopsis gallopavonis]|uniref:Uncharacterized protein n=1 Tax=Mycoplasmopsis gallopavonis TaxID=76629 RepID=A0A449AZ30_9BACT|nr:hypothetical protein [Mycoplasmopsis gallopavonis]RIV16824.1 hypothetical protein D1113_00845 [Mycoplasmopsis gallopavonis]VEU72809.1 Uncharacterised protein [Mycoplasmopsis gallopavonis]
MTTLHNNSLDKLDKKLYEQQCKVIKEIFATNEVYREVIKYKLFQLKFNKMHNVGEKVEQEINDLEKMMKGEGSLIRMVLEFMTPSNAWIIEKCFLDQTTKFQSEWYLERFSKTTFYKRKKEAIQEFLKFYFHNVS